MEISSHDLLLPAQSLALGLAAAQHLHLLPPWQSGRYGYVATMTPRRTLDRSDDDQPDNTVRCKECNNNEWECRYGEYELWGTCTKCGNVESLYSG